MDRKSIGEEPFWDIIGGGGSYFGVILVWKLRLAHIPQSVIVFKLEKTIEQGATKLLSKWQGIADKLHVDLFQNLIIRVANDAGSKSGKTIEVSFHSLFLGLAVKLLHLMQDNFPELSLDRSHCTEMSWMDSVLYLLASHRPQFLDVSARRSQTLKHFFKAKISDFVIEPISEAGLEGLWRTLLGVEASSLFDIDTLWWKNE